MSVVEQIKGFGVVPVGMFRDDEEADIALSSLIENKLPVVELTLRTDNSLNIIKYAIKKYSRILIGAGTVISKEQCEQAIEAGAQFIVSPGISESVARLCYKNKIDYFPGILTPSEIIKATSMGLKHVKFFPASEFGGVQTIKALSGAFPNVRFMPTGGVKLDNLKEYLAFDKIFACGGSWMFKGDYQKISENIRAVVDTVHNIRGMRR